MLDFSTLPNFCAHEHWGSIFTIGLVGDQGVRADFERGALPVRRTGVIDLLIECYFGGWLAAAGFDADAMARRAGHENFATLAAGSPAAALRLIRPALREQQLTGAYQCTRRGLLQLYGVDISIDDEAAITELDRRIAAHYERPFEWYPEAMRQAGFSELIRPVQPEFYLPPAEPVAAAQEAAFTRTLLRIDPLLAMHSLRHPRRDRLAELTGIDPGDAASWRECLGRLCDIVASQGGLGIKQLQAYSRPLEFIQREDREVVWRGELTAAEERVFQDWMVNECCRQANDRGWPHQAHVGTHNLGQSSPLPLAALATRYPRMKLVQLHVWPFLAEAGFLTKHHPNVYIDTCWQPILNPQFQREALRGWLGYLPAHKVMCSHDATTVEMAVGSSLFTRETLAETLAEQSRGLGLDDKELCRIASDLLHNNAVEVYGVGRRVDI